MGSAIPTNSVTPNDTAPAVNENRDTRPGRRRRHGGRRSSELLRVLSGARAVALVTHINPDPDAIAAVMGLRLLITTRLGLPAEVICPRPPHAGENSVAARITGFSDAVVREPNWASYDRVVLLDTQPMTGFHPVPNDVAITAVIDHHSSVAVGRGPPVAYQDVRREYGATSSIITDYLLEQRIPLTPALAAGLLFGIETDTAGLAGNISASDKRALSELHLHADVEMLKQMRFARLPPPYYEAFLHGLLAAFVYEDALLAYLGELESPEMTAIVADFLLRLEAVRRVLCLGRYKEAMLLSLRTLAPTDDAARQMRSLVRGYGNGGGHRAKAGGQIPFRREDADSPRVVYGLVRQRFLRLLHIKAERGRRLVQRRDILAGVDWP